MTERYKFLEDVFSDDNSIEDEYIHYRSVIESKLNSWGIPYLNWWLIFMQRKLILQWEDINKLEDKDILPITLELIWELIKEKKVKVQRYEIEEYEKPREIIKKFGKREFVEYWDFWYKVWWLDPCKYKDNNKLEEDVKSWKKETYKLYKYVLEKYGQDEVNGLLDILEIRRSDCYEWEIEIE